MYETLVKRLRTLSEANLIDGSNCIQLENEIAESIQMYNYSAEQERNLWAGYIDQLLFSSLIHANSPNSMQFRASVFAHGRAKAFSEQYLLGREAKIKEALLKKQTTKQEKIQPRSEDSSNKTSNRKNQLVHQPRLANEGLQDQTVLQPDNLNQSRTQKIYPSNPLFRKAELIAEVFEANNLLVEILEPCGDSPRCDEFYFRKRPSDTFSSFRKLVLEAISNAGYDPADGNHGDTPLLERANNVFALQVIRPVDEWQILPWMGLSDEMTDEQISSSVVFLRERMAQKSWETPITKIGILTNGKTAICSYGSSCLAFGDSNGGKSAIVKVIALSLAFAFSPQQATFDLMDFKGGLTFGVLQHLPHVRQFIHDGCDPDTGEEYSQQDLIDAARNVFLSLAEDAKERKVAFLEQQVESIQEYNERFPDRAYQWRFLFIGEYRKAKEVLGELLDYYGKEIITQWRAFGLILVTETQYPNMDDAFPPAVRSSFGTKIAVRMSGQGSVLMFAGNPLGKFVPLLVGKGDFLYSSDQMSGRGQAFYITNDLAGRVIKALNHLYSANRLNQSRQPSLNDELSNWFATNPPKRLKEMEPVLNHQTPMNGSREEFDPWTE